MKMPRHNAALMVVLDLLMVLFFFTYRTKDNRHIAQIG